LKPLAIGVLPCSAVGYLTPEGAGVGEFEAAVTGANGGAFDVPSCTISFLRSRVGFNDVILRPSERLEG